MTVQHFREALPELLEGYRIAMAPRAGAPVAMTADGERVQVPRPVAATLSERATAAHEVWKRYDALRRALIRLHGRTPGVLDALERVTAAVAECGRACATGDAAALEVAGGAVLHAAARLRDVLDASGDGTRPAVGTPDPTRGPLLTLADVARNYDVPKPALTRACQKAPGELGYLPHVRRGRWVYVAECDARDFARTHDATREQRAVGRLVGGGRVSSALVAAKNLAWDSPRERPKNRD